MRKKSESLERPIASKTGLKKEVNRPFSKQETSKKDHKPSIPNTLPPLRQKGSSLTRKISKQNIALSNPSAKSAIKSDNLTTKPKRQDKPSELKSFLYCMSIHVLKIIIRFCADSALSIVRLRTVCKRFRFCIDGNPELWILLFHQLSRKEQSVYLKQNNIEKPLLADELKLREYILKCEKENYYMKLEKFLAELEKCFNYGAIKFNTLNKIIEKMDIRI